MIKKTTEVFLNASKHTTGNNNPSKIPNFTTQFNQPKTNQHRNTCTAPQLNQASLNKIDELYDATIESNKFIDKKDSKSEDVKLSEATFVSEASYVVGGTDKNSVSENVVTSQISGCQLTQQVKMDGTFNDLDINILKESLGKLSTDSVYSINHSLRKYTNFYSLYFGDEYTHNIGFLTQGSKRICTQCWTSPKAKETVVLSHGLYDHTGLYSHVIEFFLHKNYAVIMFDLPGHGLSDGDRASIDDFSTYSDTLEMVANWAQNNLPEVTSLFGQSTGAAIIMESLFKPTLCSDLSTLNSVIFFAPLVEIKDYSYSKCVFFLGSMLLSKITREFSDNSNDQKFLDFLKVDPLQPKDLKTKWLDAYFRWYQKIQQQTTETTIPILTVQGTDDQTVNGEYNTSFINERFKNNETLILQDARHHLANEKAQYREQYFSKMSQWLANLEKNK